MAEEWIEVVHWRRYQHYKDRAPTWIKNHTSLLHDPDYLDLTATQRAVLHGLWMIYAVSAGKVPENTAKLSRELNVRVTKRTLKALNDAGFIRTVASKPLALTRSKNELLRSSSEPARRSPTESGDERAPENEEEPSRDPDAIRRMRELAQTILEQRAN